MRGRAVLLVAIVALGFPADEARALTGDQPLAVPGSDGVSPSGSTASFADKPVAVGTLVMATGLHLSGTAAGTPRATTKTDIMAPRLTIPTGARSKVHGGADAVLSYVLGDIGLVAGEAKRPFAKAQACSASATLSMSAVKNMRLLDFMRAVVGKAGMRVVDKGIAHMRITGDAFSGISLNGLLREASADGHFLADIKGCNVVLSPLPAAKDVVHAQSATGQLSGPRQETDLANLVLAAAKKSGRSVTMIGVPVPLRARLDGVSDMDAQALASAINHAAAGVLRVTVKAETIVLEYLAANAAAATDAQERFREQGRFLVLPALEQSRKAAKRLPSKGDTT